MMIENYKILRKEGFGRYAIMAFFVYLLKLRIQLFWIRQIFKYRIRRQCMKWMRKYVKLKDPNR